MNDLITHYENYKKTHGPAAYRMTDAKDTSRVRFLQEYLVQFVKPGGKVLDIGCGDMYLAKSLPQFTWVGIDIAPDMSDGRAVKHDLMTNPYPLPTAEYDAIVCSEVLEHVWDLRRVHVEAKRLLKRDGHYIISTPNFDNIDYMLSHHRPLLFDENYSHHFEHIRQYNYEVHERLLKQAGFKVKDYTGCDAHYVKFFEKPRNVLYNYFTHVLKLPITQATVDQLLGKAFSLNDHTIMLVSTHANSP